MLCPLAVDSGCDLTSSTNVSRAIIGKLHGTIRANADKKAVQAARNRDCGVEAMKDRQKCNAKKGRALDYVARLPTLDRHSNELAHVTDPVFRVRIAETRNKSWTNKGEVNKGDR